MKHNMLCHSEDYCKEYYQCKPSLSKWLPLTLYEYDFLSNYFIELEYTKYKTTL